MKIRPKLHLKLSILIFLSIATGLLAAVSLNAKECIFCKTEVIENQSVFEGEYFSILLDSAPRVPGHLLVIPKRHVLKAHELSQNEWAEMPGLISKAVNFFSEFLRTDNYVILEKNGCKAFQQVPHIHFHLFPVHSEDWADIFDIVPDPLGQEDLEQQTFLFRKYFNEIQ